MQEKIDEEEFTLVKFHTNDNGSDILTENLPLDRLRLYRQKTRLADSAYRSEGEFVRNLSLLWEKSTVDASTGESTGSSTSTWRR